MPGIRNGSPYPCVHLSGCGVGYKLMQAFALSNGLPTAQLESLLDLVADGDLASAESAYTHYAAQAHVGVGVETPQLPKPARRPRI